MNGQDEKLAEDGAVWTGPAPTTWRGSVQASAGTHSRGGAVDIGRTPRPVRDYGALFRRARGLQLGTVTTAPGPAPQPRAPRAKRARRRMAAASRKANRR